MFGHFWSYFKGDLDSFFWIFVGVIRLRNLRSSWLARNVVPAEIEHMPCTGGLVPGDRVAALRQLLVVPKGGGKGAGPKHQCWVVQEVM